MKGIQIHNCSYMKRRKEKESSLYKGCKLFLSEDRFEVMKVDCGVCYSTRVWTDFGLRLGLGQ